MAAGAVVGASNGSGDDGRDRRGRASSAESNAAGVPGGRLPHVLAVRRVPARDGASLRMGKA